MTPAALHEWLADPRQPQRDKLDALYAHVAAIRAYSDDDYRAAIREIKRRLKSPKLAGELNTLLGALARVMIPVAHVEPEEPAVAFEGTDPDDPRGCELEARIAADPEDRGRYLVYGDHLTDRGDPLGEFIAIGLALEKNPTQKAMRTAHDAWLAQHGARYWGGLAGFQRALRTPVLYLGFVKSCALIARFEFRATPLAELVAALFAGPGRFLQELVIEPGEGLTAIAATLGARPRPTLRKLKLGASREHLGDLSAMWPGLVGLRELELERMAVGLGAIAAPRLEKLAINYGPGEDGTHTIAPLQRVLRAEQLPALRSLAITNCECADELCGALAASRVLPQLTELDLSMGTMTAAGAAILVRERERFAHLAIKLELNYLSETAGAELAASLEKLELGEQRSDDGGYRHAADYE
ncbi:MAG: hypothetical protein ABI867_31265 [Kofleriaceae bacterium]